MQVSQGGVAGEFPVVLVRFREALRGVGGITGPYRGYLYYWKTTRNDVIDEVSQALWPFLSREKRAQLGKAAVEVGRAVPVVGTDAQSSELERAWAAGLFDGEGCVTVTGRRDSTWRGVQLYLSQSSAVEAPDTIARFHRAVRGLGSLTGPHQPRSPWSRLPQYHWQTNGRHKVSAVIRLLWPWLSEVKRSQIRAASIHLDQDLLAEIE